MCKCTLEHLCQFQNDYCAGVVFAAYIIPNFALAGKRKDSMLMQP